MILLSEASSSSGCFSWMRVAKNDDLWPGLPGHGLRPFCQQGDRHLERMLVILRFAQDDKRDSSPVRSQVVFSPNICSWLLSLLAKCHLTHGSVNWLQDCENGV